MLKGIALPFVLTFFLGLVETDAAVIDSPTSQIPLTPGTLTAAQLPNTCVTMERATAEQMDSTALSLAIQILKTVPVDTGDFSYWDDRGQALLTLKHLNALEEYKRKVTAYYKGDIKNLTYDKLMAECLVVQDAPSAVPYLEKVFQLDPKDVFFTSDLAWQYSAQHNDAKLLPLLDFAIENNLSLSVPYGAQVETVEAYARAGQLDHLTQLYLQHIQNYKITSGNDLTTAAQIGEPLETKLHQLGMVDDLLKVEAALINPTAINASQMRLKLAARFLEKGDKEASGEQCEAILFPSEVGISSSSENYVPDATTLAVSRIARTAGQLDRLKKRAQAQLTAAIDPVPAEQTLALILVVGHDPEALTFLPTYYKDVTEASDVSRGGTLYEPLYAIVEELLDWPEGKGLLESTLKTAYQIESHLQPQNFLLTNLKVAQLALKMKDLPMAQGILKAVLEKCENPSSGGILPNYPSHLPDIENLTHLGIELIQANLPDQVSHVVALIANKSQSQLLMYPDSRSERIASIGEEALDAGQMPLAKQCAETALKQLHAEWQNTSPPKPGEFYISISPHAVHLIGDLLLRLGLMDDFADLSALIGRPSTTDTNLDRRSLSADLRHLAQTLGDPIQVLTPCLWLREKPTSGGGIGQEIMWDLSAQAGETDRQGIGNLFSTTARGLPRLQGKFNLQILAGVTPDALRVIQSVPGVAVEGAAKIVLKPDDRYIRGICQTAETQPTVFIGPVVPISLGPNLVTSFQHHIYDDNNGGGSDMDNEETPLTTEAGKLEPVSRGPDTGDDAQSISFPNPGSHLELVGPKQEITRGATYCQSGWLKGSGQWSIRFFDAKGTRLPEEPTLSSTSTDDWHFVQQSFGAADWPGSSSENDSPDEMRRQPGMNPIPKTAVAFEPFLRLYSGGSVQFADLYLGVMNQEAPPPPNPDRTVLMSGLQGATSIVEAPQGNLLAEVSSDGGIRCFDLSIKKEVGLSSKLPALPSDVSFANQGTQIVAADTSGNIMVRPVQGNVPGRVVYQAHFRIDFLAGSDTSLIAIGNRDEGDVTVIDIASGKEVSRIQVDSLPLTDVILSPDGMHLFCRYADLDGKIWNTTTGVALSITEADTATPSSEPNTTQAPHFMPSLSPGSLLFRRMNPRASYLPRERGALPIDELALAHFFKIPTVLKSSEWQRPCWLQVQNGFFVRGMDTSLVYSMKPETETFQQTDTGPITAYCLSTQSNDVYTVSQEGTLALWKLPKDVQIPQVQPPPQIKIVPPSDNPNIASQPATHGLIIALLKPFPEIRV
jgi:WD40 repeat protein/tetratricopeptide (TPR) repeat protein